MTHSEEDMEQNPQREKAYNQNMLTLFLPIKTRTIFFHSKNYHQNQSQQDLLNSNMQQQHQTESKYQQKILITQNVCRLNLIRNTQNSVLSYYFLQKNSWCKFRYNVDKNRWNSETNKHAKNNKYTVVDLSPIQFYYQVLFESSNNFQINYKKVKNIKIYSIAILRFCYFNYQNLHYALSVYFATTTTSQIKVKKLAHNPTNFFTNQISKILSKKHSRNVYIIIIIC
eukprot:TRINITY_DN9521_c0_g1_i4.p1 TRINITY_DN9521_c0_g1~~TRINITY_DN9521_c0_g1_i4.p1  ORF type:complete len:227 (-),score=-13.22 TRINITY_DN9521_c0_g1_i4:84-764(-)